MLEKKRLEFQVHIAAVYFPCGSRVPVLCSLDVQGILCLLVLEDAASSTTNNAGDRFEQIADSLSDLVNKTIDCILSTAHNVVGHLFDTTDEAVGRVLDLGHGRGGIVDEATDSASNITLQDELITCLYTVSFFFCTE